MDNRHKKKCGCGKPDCGCRKPVNKFVDISQLSPIDWEMVPFILGLDDCGKVFPVYKPEYELTSIDRDKLDSIIINGEGDKYLSDDGSYKSIQDIHNITLTYSDSATNFILLNQDKLLEIVELLKIEQESFVRLVINGYSIPLSISFDNEKLSLQFEHIVSVSPVIRIPEDKRTILRVNISVNILTTPYTLISYIVDSYETIDLIVNGDGENALYDNGEYKPTYTKIDTDNKIHEITRDELDNYYTKDETDKIIDDKIGQELDNVVEYDSNNDVRFRNDLYLRNDSNVFGIDTDGSAFNLIELSRFNIIDFGSSGHHFNINSEDRPTVQLPGESGTESHGIAYIEEIGQLRDAVDEAFQQEIANRKAGDDALQDQITDNYAEYTELKDTVNNAFLTVNNELNNLDSRVTVNESNITTNAGDINELREILNNQSHFRGVYATSIEIVTEVSNPENGDYAYSLESGTIWIYDGTNWSDSNDPIPSGVYNFSNNNPLMDGAVSPGSGSEIARWDHRHPSDTTKANVSDLSSYLPLAGNSQTNQMTGNIWLGSANQLNLSDSGNSYLGLEPDAATIELRGNGSGGVDITSELGIIKANGQRIIVNGQNTPNVQVASDIINLNGGGAGGSAISLGNAQLALSGNILAGTFIGNVNIASSTGNFVVNTTTGKMYYGSSDTPGNEVARVSGIENLQDQINSSEADIIGKVNKSGDQMTGNLAFSNGADIILGYSQESISTIYAQDEEGNTYNGVQLRTNVPTTPTPIDQFDFGDINTQFNAQSEFIPTVDIPVGDYTIDQQYDYPLPSTKYRYVIDRWLTDHYYNKTEISGLIPDFTNYYTKTETDNLLDEKANASDLSNVVTLDTEQNILAQKSFYLPITLLGTSSIFFQSYMGNRIQNTSQGNLNIQAINANNIFLTTSTGIVSYNGNEIATVADIPTLSNVVTIDGDQAITGTKTFPRINIGSSNYYIYRSTGNDIVLNSNNGIDLISNGGIVKYNGIEVATVDDIPDVGEYVTTDDLDEKLNDYQGRLIAGENITIVDNGDNTYTINSPEFESVLVVTELPEIGEVNRLYLLINEDTGSNNVYDKYVWVNNTWEYLGSSTTSVDLDNYYTKGDVDSLLSDKANRSELELKANSSDVYTISQTDNLLADKANLSDIPSLTNIVDLTSNQTITGSKTFTNSLFVPSQVVFGSSLTASFINFNNNILNIYGASNTRVNVTTQQDNLFTWNNNQVATINDTLRFGTIQSEIDSDNIVLGDIYDIRVSYGSISGSKQFGLSNYIEGREYIISINNLFMNDITVIMPTDTITYQVDIEEFTIPSNRVAELSVRCVFGKFIIRYIGS